VSPALHPLRIAIAQINPTVGDVTGNAELAVEWIGRGKEAGADLVVLPELTVTGYPPEDLLLKRHFLSTAEEVLPTIAAAADGIVALVGTVCRDPALHNALAVLADGAIRGLYRKVLLPNYGVFDERRYFEPGPAGELIELGGARIGLTICEDVWFAGPPASTEALSGASLLINASASPYHRGKGVVREAMIAERARENGVAMALCNCVGGQDELVFDGHSVVVDAEGRTLARAGQFAEELLVCDLVLGGPAPAPRPDGFRAARVIADIDRPSREPPAPLEPSVALPLDPVAEVYAALTVGLRDYVHKNDFSHVVLGLSGGIDSALVAVIAADALGSDRVSCVVMPSPHSSEETQADARQIAERLGCERIELPIGALMTAYASALSEPFAGTAEGVAEENIQARIRGNLVMALSNKFGWLALSTGNKSETSVGYTTLYGDMAGGFAVIKDVPKTLVYELARARNEAPDSPIPDAVVERPPSAELRPDQLDADSLPPYEILDRALEEYIERDGGLDQLIDAGIDRAVAERVIGLVDRAEYKRRQAPPGVKITAKAFGRDRRMPITNRFRG
jgi:NAD+ synthase (glutamine-hydrolysing)